jgi:hypothetical protein
LQGQSYWLSHLHNKEKLGIDYNRAPTLAAQQVEDILGPIIKAAKLADNLRNRHHSNGWIQEQCFEGYNLTLPSNYFIN